MNRQQAEVFLILGITRPDLVNRRKYKRAERITEDHPGLYDAYYRGLLAAYHPARRNPFPPGKRHDEWQRTYDRSRVRLESEDRPTYVGADPF